METPSPASESTSQKAFRKVKQSLLTNHFLDKKKVDVLNILLEADADATAGLIREHKDLLFKAQSYLYLNSQYDNEATIEGYFHQFERLYRFMSALEDLVDGQK
ncbi:hypothetical protein [Xanthocytophaga agilis]|uniref:Uncharacterized protein n=1 Tax=Xanthocytophaga agilis TaxID=3048010 RepID=A0AAE3UHJ0_9BACT|nr:hypothetical protein [Xanthocytophaga agilis]MDJ1505515.1 hypothetical protein [Xanthocytophaga agilis]